MRKLILATVVLTLSGLSPVLARGGMSGGMHGGGMMGGMHGGGMHNSMGFGLAALRIRQSRQLCLRIRA